MPQTGRLLGGDEFDGPGLTGWDIVRPTEDVTVADGRLSWRLTSTDLTCPRADRLPRSPETRHEIFNETNRDEVTAVVIDWLYAHTP